MKPAAGYIRVSTQQQAEEDKRLAILEQKRLEQQEEQRKSFAYGNAGLENELITREMINQQAEKLKSEDD